MNEGANKAILVTTSDYGGDSFKFAQGKPIALMNGSHLLHYVKTELGLTDAYINIEEAKKLI
jgi:restriction system protein